MSFDNPLITFPLHSSITFSAHTLNNIGNGLNCAPFSTLICWHIPSVVLYLYNSYEFHLRFSTNNTNICFSNFNVDTTLHVPEVSLITNCCWLKLFSIHYIFCMPPSCIPGRFLCEIQHISIFFPTSNTLNINFTWIKDLRVINYTIFDFTRCKSLEDIHLSSH